MLTIAEINSLSVTPLVITYELGIRFLTDFLKGDQYFKITHPTQNLERAKVQFKLLESMEVGNMNRLFRWNGRSDQTKNLLLVLNRFVIIRVLSGTFSALNRLNA